MTSIKGENMKSVEECIKMLEFIMEEFEVTDQEKKDVSDAVEYLWRYDTIQVR